jgi:hypothetical protein
VKAISLTVKAGMLCSSKMHVAVDLLQEGKWNVLWLSGRFQTLVRMREDMPRGRVLSHSLKSSIFHAHDGEWRVM